MAAICLLLVGAAAFASDGADEWFTATKVSIREGMPGRQQFSAVTMTIAKNHDTRIESSGFVEGKSYSETMLVISGNYLAAKNVDFVPGAEIDSLDAPVIEIQTAMKLMARALPAGPHSVVNSTEIKAAEASESLEVTTQSASGSYPAPWSVSGSIARDSATRLSFTFLFKYAGAEHPMSFSGTWEKAPAVDFPDSLPLVGWRVFHLGVHESNGGAVVDYGALELSTKFSSIGELRRYAKEHRGGP